jgi:hypothetical protein
MDVMAYKKAIWMPCAPDLPIYRTPVHARPSHGLNTKGHHLEAGIFNRRIRFRKTQNYPAVL